MRNCARGNLTMDKVLNALMIRSADYGENDKILTLLTAEEGRITAGIKGVKKPNAKLKFAAQPFCFAEYVLSVKGDRYTVINCSECESFYDLRTDIDKFYAASAVCEAAGALSYEGSECAELFTLTVNALAEICSGEESRALISYLVGALKISGYGISAENCSECGKSLVGEDGLRFDMDTGSFTCADCGEGAKASRVTYNVLREICGKSYESDFITSDGEKRALRLLREYLSYKLGLQCKSLSEYIRLI